MWLQRVNPQLNFVWQGRWPQGHVEAARRIYDHELVLFTEGECRVRIERRSYRCGPGTFLIIPPDCVHVSTALSPLGAHRYCLHFDWSFTRRTARLPICVFLPGRLRRSGIRATPDWVDDAGWHGTIPGKLAALQLVRTICSRWEGGDRATRATCRALLLDLLLRLLTPPRGPARPRQRQAVLAAEVKQLLDGEYTASDSIQNLLETLDFSYAHLCRTFKSQYGISPLGYLNAGRVEKAKALLQEGRLSVKQVAQESGVADPAYFSRLFRRCVGMPPSAYRLRGGPGR